MLHPPSVGEFLAEFIGHYIAIEGKLWRTLALLLFRPGRLTIAYMAGKRVQYMQPLRLFLTLSVIFFALLQFGGFTLFGTGGGAKTAQAGGRDKIEMTAAITPHPSDDAVSAPAAPLAPTGKAPGTIYSLTIGVYELHYRVSGRDHEMGFDLNIPDEHAQSLLLSAARVVDPDFSSKLNRFGLLPVGEKAERLTHGFMSRMPYAIFFMVPVFALLLKLLYLGSGRRYGEHLLFSLHVMAFVFVIAIGMDYGYAYRWLFGLLAVWLSGYIGLAMQRFYGGRYLATGVRWLALILAYLAMLVVAMTQVMLVTAITSA